MLIAILVGVFSLFILLYIYEYNRTRRIRKILSPLPGPSELPFLGAALEFGQTSVELLKNLQNMIDDYGPVVKVWMGPEAYVILSDAKDIEAVLSSNVHLNKPQIYAFLEKWLGNGLVSSPADIWKTHRKLLTPAFHFKILETYIDTFNKNARIMTDLLKRELGKEKFDVSHYVDKCTLDVICETAMATSIDAQLNEESEFTKSLKVVSDAILVRAFKPWLFPDVVFNLSPLGRKYNQHLDYINNYVDQVISQKKKAFEEEEKNQGSSISKEKDVDEEYYGTKKRLVFLDLILKYAKDSSIHLNDKDIRDEVNTFMFAGHDTTSSTISFAIYSLASNPEIQDKVVEEVRTVLGDSDRDPTYQELLALKYTEQVIKETLRLYPAVPYIGRYLYEDFTLPSGHLLPAGTSLSLVLFKLHRDPKVFPEPEKFNPDNFSPEKMVNRFAFAHTPFSAGPRNCIGQKFAMLEMKALLSRLLRTYKVKAMTPEPLLASQLILRSENGINVQLERRL
ncbi:cytochrome P450 4C1-like [Macrosteles quadrilineatus]|uniref:cytochrome P450 4C1-like n=1 Tax=Macrosteles quadrilineatus TaxID=74068 RepID=UPI0023E254F8|nr:cytochrome P450 4C1-like [Macrosteles quadrilineatus]XP_054270350.1 cytochrome P450 4C1-like [Macrosteles quadrilineatus]XP_054270351.1 cytochrome P450 4C1-like [Macrosteles quadrilineatus]